MRVSGAGRTDAGVHAFGQVLHADVPVSLGNVQLQRLLNRALRPQGIDVLSVESVDQQFHARFSARQRSYIYHLTLTPYAQLPLSVLPWVWVIEDSGIWDKNRFKRALGLFKGEHDFTQFTVGALDQTNRVRRVSAVTARVIRIHDFLNEKAQPVTLYQVRIVANGFLRQMVRLIISAAVEVARGQASLEDLKLAVQNKQPWARRYPAPAQGLVLKEVKY